MGMRRRLFAAALAVLISMGSVSVASANVSTAPGRAATFYRGITTIVTTWNEVIGTETESRVTTLGIGACEAQSIKQNEERIKTTTRYYTRTVLHRGTANSNGLLLSDTTLHEDVVTYSEWVAVGDPFTEGVCPVADEGNGNGNNGNGNGNGGGNGTGNEGNGNGNSGGNGKGNKGN